jgi:hypothetical protein
MSMICIGSFPGGPDFNHGVGAVAAREGSTNRFELVNPLAAVLGNVDVAV